MSYEEDLANKKRWLENLKAGDEVVVNSHRSGLSIAKVSRVTKAQIFIAYKNLAGNSIEYSYWKKDGYEVGRDAWYWSSLAMPTDDIRNKIQLSNLREKAQELIKEVVIPSTKEDVLRLIEAIKPFVERP
jgi:hypothetical protein